MNSPNQTETHLTEDLAPRTMFGYVDGGTALITPEQPKPNKHSFSYWVGRLSKKIQRSGGTEISPSNVKLFAPVSGEGCQVALAIEPEADVRSKWSHVLRA